MPRFFLQKWPVKAVIYEIRGNALYTTEDKARRFADVKTGESFHRLKKRKQNTVPFPLDLIYTTETQKNTVYLFSPEPMLYFPIKLTKPLENAFSLGDTELVLQLLPKHIKRWMEHNDKEVEEVVNSIKKWTVWRDWFGFRLYKNYAMTDPRGGLEKMLPLIGLLLTMVLFAVAVFIMFRGMEGMVDRTAASEVRWNQLNERFMDQNDRMLNLVETGKVPVSTVEAPPPGV